MFNSFRIKKRVRILQGGGVTARCRAAQELGEMGDVRAVEALIVALDARGEVSEVLEAAANALGMLRDVRAVEPLIRQLGGFRNGYSECEAAAKALGDIGDVRAVEPLIVALGDGGTKLRSASADALGKLGQTRAIVPLINALARNDDWGCPAAARALAKLGEPQWESLIRGDYSDLTRLAESADPRLLDALFVNLEKRSNAVVKSALAGIARKGNQRAIEQLLKTLIREVSEGDYSNTNVSLLVELGASRAVEPLIAVTRRHRHGIEYVIDTLGELGDTRAVEPLLEALEWPQVNTATVVRALGKLGDRRATEPLISAFLHTRSYEVAKALGRLGDKRAVEPLIRALDEEWNCADEVVPVLGELGDSRAVPALIQYWRKSNRPQGIEALEKLHDPQSDDILVKYWSMKLLAGHAEYLEKLTKAGEMRNIQTLPLIQVLSHECGGVRAAVAKTLAQLGEPQWSEAIRGKADDWRRMAKSCDSRALEPLILVLGNKDYSIRRAAVEALEELESIDPVPQLIALLTSKSWCQICGSAECLGRLKDPRAVAALIDVLYHANGECRIAAAKALLEMARHTDCWRSLSPSWGRVRSLIEEPRKQWTARVGSPHSDNLHDEDHDTGIGLIVPNDFDADQMDRLVSEQSSPDEQRAPGTICD